MSPTTCLQRARRLPQFLLLHYPVIGPGQRRRYARQAAHRSTPRTCRLPQSRRRVSQSVVIVCRANTQAEKVVDRTGKPVGENSSNAQIRTSLDEQRQMIIAEYCEKIGHHELQAVRAEEERQILREELWR